MATARARLTNVLCFLILGGVAAPTVVRAQQTGAPSQAACVVRLGPKTLVMQDPWSRRYALPGGAVQPGETLEQAAVGQMRATTGLEVHATRRLGALGSVAVFDCQLTTPVDLLPRDAVMVPAWARYTTIEARFVNAESLKPGQWRYLSQAEATVALCAMATPHDTTWARASAAPTSALFDAELHITRFVQGHVPRGWKAAIEALSQLGTQAALYTVAIAVWCGLGYRLGLELMLYMMGVTLLNCLIKQMFQWPRPFHLDPLLQLQYQSSFGFPSGHTTCATSLALWTAARAVPNRRGLRAGLLLCVLACSFSRIYLGVHFVHDVVGAWLESLLVCAVYLAWLRRAGQQHLPLAAWAIVILGLGSIALYRAPEPDPIVLMCVGAGVLLGALGCRGPFEPWPWPSRALLATAMSASMFGLTYYIDTLKPAEASLQACLIVLVSGGLLRGLLLPMCYAVAAVAKTAFEALRRAKTTGVDEA